MTRLTKLSHNYGMYMPHRINPAIISLNMASKYRVIIGNSYLKQLAFSLIKIVVGDVKMEQTSGTFE
jgi:hypothetical protein